MSLEHSAFRREILGVAMHLVKKKGTLCLVHRVELTVKKHYLLPVSRQHVSFLCHLLSPLVRIILVVHFKFELHC